MPTLHREFYDEHYRDLLQHQLPWFKWLLALVAGAHLALAIGRLGADLKFLGPEFARLKCLDLLVVLLSIASRTSWAFLFRHPHKFAAFLRPTKPYRWAVRTILAASTLLVLGLHILQLLTSIECGRRDFGYFVVQIAVWLAACSFCVSMGRRFLLNDDDEHYEPNRPLLLGAPTAQRYSSSRSYSSSSETSVMELSSDLSAFTPRSKSHRLLSDGHLHSAYAVQFMFPRATSQVSEDDHDQPSGASAAGPSHMHVPDVSSNTETSPPCCWTVARFDYMRESRLGPHSWVSDPIVALLFAIFSVVISVLTSILVYENTQHRLPYQNGKYALLAPLGCLLIWLYAAKHRLRQSLFWRRRIPLPEPWIETPSLIGKPLYMHSHTGAVANSDPRLRAFPDKGQGDGIGPRGKKYMMAYNACLSTCTEYWGHVGRDCTPEFRLRPPIFRLSFLGLAFSLSVIGFVFINLYPTDTGEVKKFLDLPNLTPSDIQRLLRIIRLQIMLMVITGVVLILEGVHVTWAASSILYLSGRSILQTSTVEGTSSPNPTN